MQCRRSVPVSTCLRRVLIPDLRVVTCDVPRPTTSGVQTKATPMRVPPSSCVIADGNQLTGVAIDVAAGVAIGVAPAGEPAIGSTR